MGKHQAKGLFQSVRAFKGGTSGIKSLDQNCCLTVLAKGRSLDLQAPNRMVRRDWLLALRLINTLRATGVESIEARNRIHAFVKAKPHKPRTGSVSAGFANFFRNRAPSSLEDFGRRLSGGNLQPPNRATLGGDLPGPPPLTAASAKLQREASAPETVQREGSASLAVGLPDAPPAKKGSSIWTGLGRANSGRI